MSRDPIKAGAGRIGAYVTLQRHDPREQTAAARQAYREHLLRSIDPDGTLSPAERARRLDAARREHMARMALASVVARKRKAEARRRRNGSQEAPDAA